MKRKVKSKNNNKNLLIISKILSSEGLEFFPFYGTLLGLIREGSCIEGDDDIDLMVNIEKKEEVIRLMRKYNLTQTDGGKFFSQFTYRIGRDPVIVDFYFYEEAKEFIIERWNFYGKEDDQSFNVHYDKKDIFPLKDMFWKEIKLKIPQNSKNILRYCYGKSWHIKMDKSTDYVQRIKNNKIVFVENLKNLTNNEKEQPQQCRKPQEIIMNNKKTSVILATCNRPSLALQAVSSLYETTKHLNVELVMVVDGNIETVQKIEEYLNDKTTDTWTYLCDYSLERRGPLQSWNIGLSMTTGEIIFPSGDDQYFHPNWLDTALEYHEKHLGGYGMVALNDKLHQGNILGTTLLYDRKFCIDYLGGVCAYPVYNYYYVDNELNERAKLAGKYVWCSDSVVEHIHPGAGKRPRDPLDLERSSNNFMTTDKIIFEKRKAAGFPNNFEPAIK